MGGPAPSLHRESTESPITSHLATCDATYITQEYA